MTSQIVFKTAFAVKDSLLEPETKFFTKEIDKLIEKNNLINSTPLCGVIHQGINYRVSTVVKTNIKSFKSLHISLVSEFDSLVQQFKLANQEVQSIWQALLPIVSKYPNNPVDGLPEELAIHVSGLGSRTIDFNEVLNYLTENQRKNFNKSLPRMQYYLSLRMVI